MTARTVDADVVLAALDSIHAGLAESSRHRSHAVGVSNAKQRIDALQQQIENVAQPVAHGYDVQGVLDGLAAAADSPRDQVAITRQRLVEAHELISRLVTGESRESHTVTDPATISPDLFAWAEHLLDYAQWWDENPQNAKTIHTLVRMQGPDDDRRPVERSITSDDLRKAAALARYLAHQSIGYAVMVDVKHYERAKFEQPHAVAEAVVIDGRVVLDLAGLDELMTQAGWVES